MRASQFFSTFAAFGISATAAFAALEPQSDFQVFPSDVNLKFNRDRQSMVVRFMQPNGVHRDVTKEATFSLVDGEKARVEKGIVTPVADGETKLLVEWQGHK